MEWIKSRQKITGVSAKSYLNKDEHTGDEDKGHVKGQELEQRQRQTAGVTALLYSWRCSAEDQ